MSRKFLVTIILILFLLPFVSWYYLQSGLDWRKKAQAVMNGTQPFPSGSFPLTDGTVLTTDSLLSHVTLIAYLPCNAADQGNETVLSALFDQFKDTHKAAYVLLDTCGVGATFKAPDHRYGWFVVSCPDTSGLCTTLRKDWPTGASFALVDRKGIIRSYYNAQTKDEKRTLVEHMSLLLPRERQEEVELKRGDKK